MYTDSSPFAIVKVPEPIAVQWSRPDGAVPGPQANLLVQFMVKAVHLYWTLIFPFIRCVPVQLLVSGDSVDQL